jgi:hypothetical protein
MRVGEKSAEAVRGWWGYYQITEDRKPIWRVGSAGTLEILLASLAQTGGPEAHAAVTGGERRPAESNPQQPRSDAADFNRRMRKTARPVVWEGTGGAIPCPRPDQGG